MKSWITLLVSVCCAGAVAAPDARSQLPDPVQITAAFLSDLAEEARRNHPALQAANARVDAARAAEQAIPAWDDPTLRLGGMAADSKMRVEEGDLIYGVEQSLPIFGKPRAERRVARAFMDVEAAGSELRFQQLRRDLAIAVLTVALADREVDIGRQDLAWLEALVQQARQRYTTGDATQLDVLRLETELARRQTRLRTAIDMRHQTAVDLNRLLNRPLEAPWPPLLLPPLAGPVPYSEALVEQALQAEPELFVRRQELRQAEASVEAARRQRYPDLSLGVEGRHESRHGDFRQAMVMLSVTVPLANHRRYGAAIRGEQARTRAVQLDLTDAELELRREIHELVIRIAAARRETLAYENDIVPRSQTAADSARSAWETGRGTLLDLLEARRVLLESRLEQARALTAQYIALSDLVLCCGLGDFAALEALVNPVEPHAH